MLVAVAVDVCLLELLEVGVLVGAEMAVMEQQDQAVQLILEAVEAVAGRKPVEQVTAALAVQVS